MKKAITFSTEKLSFSHLDLLVFVFSKTSIKKIIVISIEKKISAQVF